MLPGPLLKAEPLVVIIKDGRERGFARGARVVKGGGDVAQEKGSREMRLYCCPAKF